MLFKTKKPGFHVSLLNSDIVIPVKAGQTILEAALKEGLDFPFSCRAGTCGTCRCKLISGQTKEHYPADGTLEPGEIKAGMILACQNEAQSDLVIDLDQKSIEKFNKNYLLMDAAIAEQQALTHDIQKVVLRLDHKISYIPGQYAELSFDSIPEPRSYSFASGKGFENTDKLEFHIRLVPGGQMTGWFHEKNRVGERLRVRAPFGKFYLRSGNSPIIMIAGGSGMAPIKALLEGASDKKRPVTYLFGARTQRDLYCLDEIKKIQQSWKSEFKFICVLSDESSDSGWTGPRGLITEYIAGHLNDASETEAYLCGPPIMIDKSIAVLKDSGMEDGRIFFDRFTDKSHTK